MKLYIVNTPTGPMLVDGDWAAQSYMLAGYRVERITETKTMTLVGSKLEEMGAEIRCTDSDQRTGAKP